MSNPPLRELRLIVPWPPPNPQNPDTDPLPVREQTPAVRKPNFLGLISALTQIPPGGILKLQVLPPVGVIRTRGYGPVSTDVVGIPGIWPATIGYPRPLHPDRTAWVLNVTVTNEPA